MYFILPFSITAVPLLGWDIFWIGDILPSASVSLASTSIIIGLSSAVLKLSLFTTVESSTGFTVTLTVPILPCSFVYVKASVPLKSGLGIYLIVPSGLILAVPLLGWVTDWTGLIGPSSSVSLASTSISTGYPH